MEESHFHWLLKSVRNQLLLKGCTAHGLHLGMVVGDRTASAAWWPTRDLPHQAITLSCFKKTLIFWSVTCRKSTFSASFHLDQATGTASFDAERKQEY